MMRIERKVTTGFLRWVSCLILLSAIPGTAWSQTKAPGIVTQADISFNYSYVNARSAGGTSVSNLQGGSASAALHFHNCLGLVADLGGYMFTGQPAGLSANLYTYMFGPRCAPRRYGRFEPFGQALFGGGRLTATSGSVHAGENAFAMSIGGGLDVDVRHRFAIRAIQVEYLMTHFHNVGGNAVNQNNFRISAGVVFRFGGR